MFKTDNFDFSPIVVNASYCFYQGFKILSNAQHQEEEEVLFKINVDSKKDSVNLLL